jgi:VWFA-related protein
MKEFVKNVMRPGDEAMVATFNRSMKVRVPFTRDPVQIQQMLDAVAGESALGTNISSERKQTESRIREASSYDEAVGIARTHASSVEHDLRQSASSLNALMSTLAGLDGKKILVLTSEGFPMQPGREIFYFIDEIAKEKQWNFSGTLLEAMSFDSSSLIQSIARTANANGITMYTIHAAGLTGGDTFSAEHSQPTSFTVSQAAMSNTTESMHLMADMTGGLASIQTNNYALAFKRIQSDLESYYSLGYRAGTERVDRQRRIDVRVKNKSYIVRNRETFVEKSTFAEMSDRVIANLLYRTKANDLNVLVKMNTPAATDDGLFRVPVEIQIPMDSLTLLPQGETEYAGGFDVYVAVANKEGDMSDVARKSHQLRIPTSDLPRAKGKYYTYALDLLMEKGLNRVSVGVVDQISNVSGFAREQIMAQDLR